MITITNCTFYTLQFITNNSKTNQIVSITFEILV